MVKQTNFESLNGKSCIVTGSARGIGQGIGDRLIASGASVAFVDVNAEGAEAAAAAHGDNAIGVGCDVVDRGQVQGMVKKVVAAFGKIDVMYNNAGVNHQQRFMETTEENWHRLMDINALSVLIVTQEVSKQMIDQGHGGKIVNTASLAGRQAYPDIVPYCASKFAVIAITQASARYLAEHGIQVNGFSPGVVHTPLWDQLDRESIEMGNTKEPGEAMAGFAAGALVGRVSTPDDITGLALFLASSESDYMTGQTIGVDGGMYIY